MSIKKLKRCITALVNISASAINFSIRPRPAARGGGVGGVPGINGIHNFNYLIQERPLILIDSSSLRLHQKLSRGMKISKIFCSRPPRYIRTVPLLIDSWICMHACPWRTRLATVIFKLVGVSIHFEFVTLLFLILSLTSLHGLCFFA